MIRHLITCEYPPQNGGVSDYSNLVAAGLAAGGEEVHVWCPACEDNEPRTERVVVHRDLGSISPSDLRRVGRQLDQFPGPRHILVQWVPHGYGYRSMNLAFCIWLLHRSAMRGDQVEIMVHEPYLAFTARAFLQNIAAVVHRVMTTILLASTKQVWITIPRWEQRLRPYTLGRRTCFRWLPVPSNIRIADNPRATQGVRKLYAQDSLLIGHFGTYGQAIIALLEPVIVSLHDRPRPPRFLLMGRGSQKFLQELLDRRPQLAGSIFATDTLAETDLSVHIAACDLLVQPYPDGVSCRRGSTMLGLSHGKPVVTTSGHLTEPFWKDSGAVAIAPVGDATRLVQLIDQLASDSTGRLRLGTAGLQLYEQRFDLSHTIAALRGEADSVLQNACVS
jgi:glycosyltransferase involved in cell wall biosynthesis